MPQQLKRLQRFKGISVGALGRRLNDFLGQRKISHKIALGYGLSIGIAVVGATISVIVGTVYGGRASLNRDIAGQKAEWVHRLSNDISPLTLIYPQYLMEDLNAPNLMR